MRTLLILLLLLFSCTTTRTIEAELDQKDPFDSLNGCFLLYNVKTQTLEQVVGEGNCGKRLTACSTFKIPLAVMGLDAKVIHDENDAFLWNGKQYAIASWNQNQTTLSWITNSVVWVSKKITPRLGKKKIKKYLHDFRYGNEDMSGGLTEAWLTSNGNGTLKISAYEQLEFMKKLWSKQLPVRPDSMELTQKMMRLETSDNGWELFGKTGSGFVDPGRRFRIGWFIARVARGDQEYLAVTSFTDQSPQKEGSYGGFKAKEITKSLLSEKSLW